jgi:tRNA A37 threonylcarbamoyladenosine dehydratase
MENEKIREEFSRTARLVGETAVEKLRNSRVAVFGVGGVGGYAVEALVRAGVGAIDLVDNDVVSRSNINRQIVALQSTVGKKKTEVAKARALDINPEVKIVTHEVFFTPETADAFDFSAYDYVVDAIDTVVGKIELAVRTAACGTPLLSCMGAGNKLDPTRFEVADLYQTTVCPLARVMRRELKKRGVERLKVVYSKEEPISVGQEGVGKPTPASISFVPSVAGLIAAGEVIKDLIK